LETWWKRVFMGGLWGGLWGGVFVPWKRFVLQTSNGLSAGLLCWEILFTSLLVTL